MAITTVDVATPSGLQLYTNTDLDEVKAGIGNGTDLGCVGSPHRSLFCDVC